MINPVTVMKVVNERKTLIENHPEFFNFMLEQFGKDGIPEGAEIELRVARPGQTEASINMRVAGTDMKLFDGIRDMLT